MPVSISIRFLRHLLAIQRNDRLCVVVNSQDVPTSLSGVFECEIANVSCVMEFGDKGVLQYYANYHPRMLSASLAISEERRIFVSYDAALVERTLLDLMPGADAACAEWQLAYDPVSRGMLRFNRLTFHGACVEFNGKAYIFTARSGTGKSTHIKLWRRYLGSPVNIVNGDKPIISIDNTSNGPDAPIIKACGSPWAGKERWQRNVQVPLGGICILRRGTDNTIRRASKQEALDELVNRIYLTTNEREAIKALDLLDQILAHVPIHVLSCDMSEAAVRTSFEGLTGERYEAWTARNTHH